MTILTRRCSSVLERLLKPFRTPRRPEPKPAKPRKSRMPRDKEQPSSGNLLELHLNNTSPTSPTLGHTPFFSQASLNRKRRQFVATLPESHALRSRSISQTGELLPSTQQPAGRPRKIDITPEQMRLHRKAKKPRDDTESAEYSLERRRFVVMWNGISERATSEREWLEFDRVKNKLLSLKRKHHFVHQDLEDEGALERKRARSRRRALDLEKKSSDNHIASSTVAAVGRWRSACRGGFRRHDNNNSEAGGTETGDAMPMQDLAQAANPDQQKQPEQDITDATLFAGGSSTSCDSVSQSDTDIEDPGDSHISQSVHGVQADPTPLTYTIEEPSSVGQHPAHENDSDTITSNTPTSDTSTAATAHRERQPRHRPFQVPPATYHSTIDPRLRDV